MIENDFSGILLVDKPAGVTSHQVVSTLRKILKMQKIGHAGTLDPIATGLLVMLLGRATKVSQYLAGLPKSYEGTMKLGETTDSHDTEGKITEIRSVQGVTLAMLKTLSKKFIGHQLQVPPMFSAKKVNGQKLYKLARKGKSVEREPRPIEINKFEINDVQGEKVHFSVHCSKGTYVRTLVHDFGQQLGCGAHLTALRRTEIGHFSIKNAFSLEQIETMSKNEIEQNIISQYHAVSLYISGDSNN